MPPGPSTNTFRLLGNACSKVSGGGTTVSLLVMVFLPIAARRQTVPKSPGIELGGNERDRNGGR
jgi:hypothetical protein